MLARCRSFIAAVFRRSRVEAELAEEMRFHVERRADDLAASGVPRPEAERRARLEFGSVEAYKEESRQARGLMWVDDLRGDLRYAFRTLHRTPAFAATAVISLALGVGANTLVFSIVNALVLQPLPVKDPGRVVFVQRTGSFVSHSFPAYRDLRDRNVTLEGLAGYRITMMDVGANGAVAHEWGYLATGNYFDLLGVTPAAGRFFHQSDDVVPGASANAVLSYDYWQSQFGGDPSVVGSTIRINRLQYTVLGVAPAGFYGTEIFYRPHIWVPMMMQAQIEVGNPWLENRYTSNTWVVGRLGPGVTAARAEANLNAIARELGQEYANPREGARVKLTRPGLIGDAIGGPAKAFAFGVLALAGLVLLTACANLASTLAARGADRQRELAIRLSIGAGAWRIVRQLLTETVVLALIGGAAGSLVATAAARALSAWRLPIVLPVQFDVRPDLRVFLFAFLISTVAGVLFGVAPARQAAKTDPNTALKSTGGGEAGKHRWPLRDALVAVQVALCFVLVAACFTSLRGLQHALTMPLGFEPKNVTMAQFDLGLAGYSREDGERLRVRALEALSRLPGVQSAAYSNSLPLSVDQSTTVVYPDDRPNLRREEVPIAVRYEVSPGFFRTLGIRVLQGHDVDWRDSTTSPRVALVNETFARRVLHARDVVGRHFRYGPTDAPVEVIGVVQDGKYQYLTEPDTPAVFDPILQRYNSTTTLLVRSSAPTSEVAGEIRRVVAGLDPQMPLFGVGSVEQMLGLALFPTRVAAIALGGFGLLAIVLAATGIHGLVAYAVSRRQRELGIRIAIGASNRNILRLVLARIATLITAGIACGLALALAVGQLLSNIVYQASPRDPLMLGSVALVVGVMAVVACWAPARRAQHVEPIAALRAD